MASRAPGHYLALSDRLVGRRPLAGDRRVVARAHARGRQQRAPGRGAPSKREDPPRLPRPLGRHTELVVVAAEAVLLVVVACVAVAVSTPEQWEPKELVGLLVVLVLGSDFIVLNAKRFRIGASFLGIVLAMAVLGPAPATAIGFLAAVCDAIRSRTRGSYLLSNLVTYATFPLVGGLALQWLQSGRSVDEGAFAVAVFVVFMATNLLNFAMIAGHVVLLRGGSLQADVPVRLPAGAAVGARHRAAHRDGRLRLRALRRGHHRPVRARPRGLPAAAAGAAPGTGGRRGGRAPHRSARHPARGDGRAAAGDAGPARPDRRAPRRRRRPLRARARARGRPVRARTGGRPHRRAAARHRQGGAARPHPARAQRAARRRAAAGRAPSRRRRAAAAARGRARRGRQRGARPPRADRRPRLPRRPGAATTSR